MLAFCCQAWYHADMEKKRKATTLRLREQDLQAILRIRLATGIASDNQAIIFAIHDTVSRIGKEKGIPPSPFYGEGGMPNDYEGGYQP